MTALYFVFALCHLPPSAPHETNATAQQVEQLCSGIFILLLLSHLKSLPLRTLEFSHRVEN